MAIRLIDRYPNRANPATTQYPHGSGRNKSDPTADDGTPFDQDRFNDQEAFFQGLLTYAGITPSGTVDTVEDSDYLDAFNSLAGARQVDSVSALQSGSYPASLDRIWLSGYYGVGTAGGGPLYRDSSDTTTADNGGTVLVDVDGVRWKRSHEDVIYATWFGAQNNSNVTASWNSAIAYAASLTFIRNHITVRMDVQRPTLDPFLHTERLILDVSGCDITATGYNFWQLQNQCTVIADKATIAIQSSPTPSSGYVFGLDDRTSAGQVVIKGYPRLAATDGPVASTITRALDGRSFRKSHVEIEFDSFLKGVLLSNEDGTSAYYNEIHVKGVGDETVAGGVGVEIRNAANGSWIYCHELRRFENNITIDDTASTVIHPTYVEGSLEDGVKITGTSSGITIVGGAIEGGISGGASATGYGVNAVQFVDGVTILGTLFGRSYNSTIQRINIGASAKNVTYIGPPKDSWSLHSYNRPLNTLPRGAGHMFAGALAWDWVEIEENTTELALPDDAYLIYLTTDGTANTINAITGNIINSRRIRLVFGDGNTTLQNGTSADQPMLEGSMDVTPTQFSVIELERLGVSTRWFEVFRSIK